MPSGVLNIIPNNMVMAWLRRLKTHQQEEKYTLRIGIQ